VFKFTIKTGRVELPELLSTVTNERLHYGPRSQVGHFSRN
jgi:hypothetical protein